jgi:L-amino acid N-acyltransferase YncA
MEGARPAAIEELDNVVELLQQAIDQTPAERNGHLFGYPARHEPPFQRVHRLASTSGCVVLVGLVEAVIVGFALVSQRDDLPADSGTIGVVEELYVEPAAREVGVGEAMLDTAMQWCRDQGCSGIEIQVTPGARSAKNLCERSGLTARALVMHRRLDDL